MRAKKLWLLSLGKLEASNFSFSRKHFSHQIKLWDFFCLLNEFDYLLMNESKVERDIKTI